MATYFTSDQHITLRYPERGQRFARFLDLIDPQNDRLVIAGDLCDFWFTAREAHRPEAKADAGILALKSFVDKGGEVVLLGGNHDQHLEWFYKDLLGLTFDREPLERNFENSRIHLAHGHLLGGRSRWKGLMESRGFLSTFKTVPSPLANSLAAQLKKYNSRNRKVDNLRHFMVFKNYVEKLPENQFDLVVLGHVHQTIFREVNSLQSSSSVKLAVLGHWFHQSSWLKLDQNGPEFYIWQDWEASPRLAEFAQVKGPEEENQV
jgi:UDP-2,3-diacylglucosamine hydrolase